MINDETLDFKITDDGDLIICENEGLKKATKDEIIRQMAICRIKSISHDWFYDHIGANLEQHLGHHNTITESEIIAKSIEKELSKDNLIPTKDIFIVPKIDKNEILFRVFINKQFEKGVIEICVAIDIAGGVRIKNDFNP